MKTSNFMGQVLQDIVPQKIDLIDRKILYMLSSNCRISNTAIAKALKIKREVVAYRIRNLISRKIITGFFTLMDSRKLGFMIFNVYVKLSRFAEEEEIIKELVKKKEVTIVSMCGGEFDLYFYVTTRTLEEFNKMLNDFLQKYHPVIQEYVVHNFMHEYPAGNNVLFEDFAEEAKNVPKVVETKGSTFQKEFKQPKKEAKISEIDKKILSILKFNARITLKDIAKKAGITSNAVKSRIGNLVSGGVIKAFIPLISFSALGYQWYMVFLNLSGLNENKLHSYITQHQNIEWCIRCVGAWNCQLSVFAKNNKEFHKVLNEIRDSFSENITYFNSILIFNQFKFESRVG
jgi:Lrp/AsnC family leucine-responsive transcriptional regulator